MNGEIALFIEIVLGIIIIVAYFYLCYNVSQIKRKIAPKEDNFKYHFNLLLVLKQKEAAKDYLIETMVSTHDHSGMGSIASIEYVIEKYSSYMSQVGLEVDIELLNSLKQKK